jgi:hypothetical protein
MGKNLVSTFFIPLVQQVEENEIVEMASRPKGNYLETA